MLDLIGYSTIPEDAKVAASRMDAFFIWLLNIPWWAVLGFALISTMWLMWVSWPRPNSDAMSVLPKSPTPETVVKANIPLISFAHDIAHLLQITDSGTGEPYVLVRPRFSPENESFEDVEVAVEEAYRFEQGSYRRVSSERFELSWEGHPSLKNKPRIATPQKFALIGVWPECTASEKPARIAADTAYDTWNGELEPFGLYKFRLALTSSNHPRQEFTVYLSWFGRLETLVVEAENGWRE